MIGYLLKLEHHLIDPTWYKILLTIHEKTISFLNSVKNGYLAVSDLFHMFTQLSKFFTFHYHLLKSTDVWKMWLIK